MSDESFPILWRKPRVCEVTGLSPRGIDNRVRAGTFPAPVLLDARQTAWIAGEVCEWNTQRVAERDAGVVPPRRREVLEARARGGRRTQAGGARNERDR